EGDMRQKGSRREQAKPISSSVCYCDGKRELGTLELFCAGCRKWFHGRCLKDLTEFYGLSFMVCYVFNCTECSPTKKESWTPKQANFAHMCVTVLANLTYQAIKKRADETGTIPEGTLHEPVYFSLEEQIIPYFDAQWENLTSMTRRVKNTWHQTLLKTLSKETELFEAIAGGHAFALKERNLFAIGPVHEALKQIGRNKPSSSSSLRDSSKDLLDKMDDSSEGPKTRGSSKRRNFEGGNNSLKKTKFTADYSSTRIAGIASPIDFPFNREGYRYYLVEKDMCVPNRELLEQEDSGYAKPIPAHIYRVVVHPTVTLSPNDRAYQLSDDRLAVTGFEGYCIARATHAVSHGTWYYEVVFTSQPPESHIRIGWSQSLAPVQACCGYNCFSYAWRSHKGTAFHQAKGKHYATGGFKEGDVLGCLISLPSCPSDSEYKFDAVSELPPSTSYLPPSHKDLPLINFKHHYFYEEKDDVQAAIRTLQPLAGSSIRFFRNGMDCGDAFRDIYAGFYYPAVSLFQNATVRCNFGPRFRFPPPKGAKPMSARVEELYVEQTLSDILFFVENEKQLQEETATYLAS
uniref:B30.2/SPRY domain-containing protein n=1 Tax=Parascaris univalens TaxID=6257 RepID=A0A915BW96_PARUN